MIETADPMTSFPLNNFILNYHDAVLYESDVKLLLGETEWLNDACIHFYLTVLQQRYPFVKFMDPSVITFLMHQCDDDDLEEFSSSFDKTCVAYAVPINDGHQHGANWKNLGCGSHWSLLWIRYDVVCTHVDSATGRNARAAQAVADLLSRVLGHNPGISVMALRTPQQCNGYDCGLRSLAAAEILAGSESCDIECYEELLKNSTLTHPGFGREMRQKILTAVELLRRE